MRADLPAPAPAEWTIRLQPQASIDGRVVETKSGTGVADVRVLAWEDDGEASPDDARRAARADGSITAALSGADGAFSIRGLTPGKRYSVAAAGAGFARADVRRAVAAGTSGLKLGVRRAWGALLRLREANGSVPRTSTSYYGRGFGTPRWPEPDADVLGGSSPQAWLAGLDSLAPAELGHWDRLILFTAEAPQEGAPRAQFRAHLPGYQPVDVGIELQPLGRSVPEVVVTLTPDGAGLAELRVRWLGNLPATTPRGSEYAPVGYVVLRGPGSVEHSFALREPWLADWKLSGVPRGEWIVSYETESTGLRVIARECAEAPLRIGELGANATFDLRAVGALAVVVRDSAGTALQGRLSLALESLAADGTSVRRWPLRMFRRAPYVLAHVPEGLYALHVLAPGQDSDPAVAPLSVQVRPGALERATVDLPGR